MDMATNPPKGDGHRNGAVRERSQTQTPSGNWVNATPMMADLWTLNLTDCPLRAYGKKNR